MIKNMVPSYLTTPALGKDPVSKNSSENKIAHV